MVNKPILLDQERMENLSEARELCIYLRTVGDMVRLQVLRHLAYNGEMSVSQLRQAVRISQPLLSWHLGVLRRIDLVHIRREGRLVWYSLNHHVLDSFHHRLNIWVGDSKEAREQTEEQGQGQAYV